MKIVQKFQAFDGVEFNSEADCRAYEKRNAHQRLVGLSIDQVEAALSGADAELADAIEILGAKIGRDRREKGDLKRVRGAKGASVIESLITHTSLSYDDVCRVVATQNVDANNRDEVAKVIAEMERQALPDAFSETASADEGNAGNDQDEAA